MEKKIERKKKIIYNSKERLKSGWVVSETQTLKDGLVEIQTEIDRIREEDTAVDREIRTAEENGSEEGVEGSKGDGAGSKRGEGTRSCVGTSKAEDGNGGPDDYG